MRIVVHDIDALPHAAALSRRAKSTAAIGVRCAVGRLVIVRVQVGPTKRSLDYVDRRVATIHEW
jgi:hypothetical protein